MRRRRAALAALVALGAAAWLAVQLFAPAPGLRQPQRVTIAAGERAAPVAARLARAGIIRHAGVFRAAARLGGQWRRVKQGTYLVQPGMGAVAILHLFTSGRVEQVRLVIPEGWTVRQIGELVGERGLGGADPLTMADVAAYPAGLPRPPDDRLEGYLFPDTYQVSPGPGGRQALAGRMLGRLDEVVWRGLMGGRPAADGRSLHEVLTLASLVEGEAQRAEERPVIAGVLMNRLRRGQRLECDATVQYALGEVRKRLLYNDLMVDSPYNTYRHQGLPPGPINNPGRASVAAALRPAAAPYLYYVARPDGSHVFSRTFDEHRAAIRAIRGQR